MQKYYLDSALNAAREMIQSYLVNRSVEGLVKYLSPENFNFMGFIEGNVFDSAAEFRQYAELSLNQTLSYKLIDENYSVCSQSNDSCQILAKTTFIHIRTQKPFVLNYFFYFNQLDDKVICTHYHVSRQFDMNKPIRLVFFNENMPYPKLPWEIQAYNEDLLEFMNSDVVAEKSFYYEDTGGSMFPYRLVNRKYIKLLGYTTIQEFITEQNSSSLSNVHAADKDRYVEYLAKHYAENIAGLNSEPQYKYRSTYYLRYRLQSPNLADEVNVLEWGNFFTEKSRTIVNCFVLNLNESEKISANVKISSSIRSEYGIHIKQNIIVYPRSRKIKIDSETIELTPIECEIFLVLVDNLNQPIMPEKIYEAIYQNSSLRMTSNVLPMHISNIRRKLGAYRHLIQINFVKGKGYCLQI